jgi:hypothetical protein
MFDIVRAEHYNTALEEVATVGAPQFPEENGEVFMESTNSMTSELVADRKEAYEPPTARVFPFQIEERLKACNQDVTCNDYP